VLFLINPLRKMTGLAGAGSISYHRTAARSAVGCFTVCCTQNDWMVPRLGLRACTAWVRRASPVSRSWETVGCDASGGRSYLGTVKPRAVPTTGKPVLGSRVTL
jgi:hypothetical protein